MVKRKSKITKALEQVNLLEVKNKKVGGFSGGMKQRLGIAQAILKEPKILIVGYITFDIYKLRT